MPAASNAEAQSGNSFGATGNGLNALEIVIVAIVGIVFSLIIVSAFRKE